MIYQDLILHAPQWDRLHTAFQRGRLAHAYLFYGPGGSGKEGHAIELGALVNCQGAGDGGGFEDGACGECPSCRKAGGLQHPNIQIVVPLPRRNPIAKGDSPLKALRPADLENLTEQLAAKARDPYMKIHMEGAQSILINSIRELRRNATLSKAERGWRVILIFEAEKLCLPSPAAANALLKLLEEPPPETVFVLVTDRPHMLIETIRSRCLGLYFPPLTTDQAAGYLEQQAGLTSGDARILARVTGGNLPQARLLAADNDGRLHASSPGSGQALDQLVDALLVPRPADLSGQGTGWQRLVSDLAMLRRSHSLDFTFRLQLLQLWLRDLMVLQTAGEPSRVVFAERLVDLERHRKAFPDADWGTAAAAVEQALGHLERNINPTLALTNMILDVRAAARGEGVAAMTPNYP
ncbi:MAG: hypothetical protein IID14_08885 [Candidatus Marinimicrobia bacterium]|nr:hypothetical protein [Candidatus Neomarinimicrobiota bacterium]